MHMPHTHCSSGGSPNRAGGRVQQKIEKTRHCSSQAKLQTHARRRSMKVHVLVRVCGTRWPKAQPTPARPDQAYGSHGARKSSITSGSCLYEACKKSGIRPRLSSSATELRSPAM